jgi:hypothetical protein
MISDGSPDSPAELESRILRLLCAGGIAAEDWRSASDRLIAHAWSDPEHRVVYEALRAIHSTDPKTRMEQLPAQATRMGFPDVDWKHYLEPDRANRTSLPELIDRLEALKQQ